jgi:uncharacterized membrane protein YjgN (DUF898 family)
VDNGYWIVFLYGLSMICLVIGAVFGMDCFTSSLALSGLWKYAVVAAVSLIPLQLIIVRPAGARSKG